MLRNVILLIASVGGVVLLFMGYRAMTQLPPDIVEQSAAQLPSLPPPSSNASSDGAILIHTEEVAAAVPPGESTVFTVFDPRSGEAVEQYDLGSWRKAPGSDREFLVDRPKITRRLPSGMTATITADEGRIVVDGADPRHARPDSGMMKGAVSIVIDRNTDRDRGPSESRPDDLITIHLDEIEFDRELGLLRSPGAVTLTSAEVNIEGAGLELNWNQYENRVERLALAHDGRLELRGGAPARMSRDETTSKPTTTQRAKKRRAEYGYRVTLADDVTIDQFRGEQRVGGLKADRVALTYDIGGGGAVTTDPKSPTTQPTSTSAPSTQAASEMEVAATQSAPAPQKLVASWHGRMTLEPIPVEGDTPRRRIEAEGVPLTLDLGDRKVQAGRLAYHEDTQRIWLTPPEGKAIELNVGSRMHVRAASVYFERSAGLVKLIGPLELNARRSGARNDALQASAQGWCELRLKPQQTTAEGAETLSVVENGPLVNDDQFESARLIGGAQVRIGGQSLAAHELQVDFGAKAANGEPALETATAQGDVLLFDSPLVNELSGAMLEQVTRLPNAVLGAAWPTISRRQTLSCTWIKIRFAKTEEGETYAKSLEALGAVELIERDRQLRVNGEKLSAELAPGGALRLATVRGAQSPASAYARGYLIRGAEIVVDEVAQTLRTPGKAQLTFRAARTFQGRARGHAAPARVTCTQGMEIDWDGPNGGDEHGQVQFTGMVHGNAGDETLDASVLTLTLAPVATQKTQTPTWKTFLRMVRPATASRPSESVERIASRRTARREPEKLVARDARVGSASHVPGDPRPIVQQWVVAPELQIEIPLRRIQTVGTTNLYMEDRRMVGSAPPTGASLGLPSAFLSNGPSQTAMQCSRAMTYVIGEDGPNRHDSVFFDGGVIFRHVTGRDMVNFNEMLPEARNQPDVLASLKNRNAYLMCDRLEGDFAVGLAGDREAGLPARMNLNSLNAVGQVYLRDQRDNWAVTVDATRLELDRNGGIVRVLGDESTGADARVTEERPGAEVFNTPAVGREIIIDLNSNTIRTQSRVTGRTSG